MLLTQALPGAAASADGLSGPATLAVFVLIPLVLTGVIAAVVFAFSQPDDHEGFQILGHPADLSRHERDQVGPSASTLVALPAPSVPLETSEDGRTGEAPDLGGAGPADEGRPA